MSENSISCPRCGSKRAVKNGRIHNSNQNFKCKQYGRQIVLNPKNKVIEQETKDLKDKLLLEKLPLAGIARVTGVSERWLQNYVNTLYACVPKQAEVWSKKGRLTIESDEMRSFVGNKNNKQWIWLALDTITQEIVDLCVGERSRERAKELWQSLPVLYRQCAVYYTDFCKSL